MLTPELEDRLTDLLAHIYCAIRWSKINTRHNAWDVWNHRVRHASTRGTMGAFVSRLSNHFGLQSLPEEAIAIVDELTPHEGDLLDLVYREHIPVSMRAVTRAKTWKQQKYGAYDPFATEEETSEQQHADVPGDHRGPVANSARRRRENRQHTGPSLFDALGP